MPSISRRSLMGYSGTAAAGAVLGSATTTHAAQADTTAESTAETTASFPSGTEFSGYSTLAAEDALLELTFTVRVEQAPAGYDITPTEIANALSDYAVSRGWPPITFKGRPAPEAVN